MNRQVLTDIFYYSTQSQIVVFLGLVLSLAVSAIWIFVIGDPNETQSVIPLVSGTIISGSLFAIGRVFFRHEKKVKFDYFQGTLVVLVSWIIAAAISSVVYYLMDFPGKGLELTLVRRLVDSYFESMSGLTTTGATILFDIEVFPKGILFWRTFTHWIGGMGVVYMAFAIYRSARIKNRHTILSGEIETPDKIHFEDESEAYQSGIKFLKIYSTLTFTLFTLLFLSGLFFRNIHYTSFVDNAYDSVTHTLSVMGTGGFSNYNNSIAGLQNPVSEWIIAFFMIVVGISLGDWYIYLFKRKDKNLIHKLESRIFVGLILLVAFGIAYEFLNSGYLGDSIGHAFFATTTIFSTTGLVVSDYSLWPSSALAFLFVGYLIGGCVGSTAGGIKLKRLLIFAKFSLKEIHNYLEGGRTKKIEVDGVTYDAHDISIIVINIALYFLLVLFGGIGIEIVSTNSDFLSSFMASLATVGNIGPALVSGSINNGPVGNYIDFSLTAKAIMIFLMLFGRIGMLNILILFGRLTSRLSNADTNSGKVSYY